MPFGAKIVALVPHAVSFFQVMAGPNLVMCAVQNNGSRVTLSSVAFKRISSSCLKILSSFFFSEKCQPGNPLRGINLPVHCLFQLLRILSIPNGLAFLDNFLFH